MASNMEREQFDREAGGLWAMPLRLARLLLPSRSRAAAWTLGVASVVEDLRHMNRLTEGDFLAVGESLMTLLSAASQIRTDISQFTEYISGEAGERACQALAGVLTLSTETQKRVVETNRALATVRNGANHIQRAFAGFNDVVLSFHIVATLGRIETARLGNSQADLTHLADEARSCAEEVQTRVEHALQVAAGLEQCLDLTLQHVSELDIQQLATLPSVVGEVERSLQAFRFRQQQAAMTSVSLAHELESYSEAISRLVTAIQFHDITRQRIEHVIESLAHLLGGADPPARRSGPSLEEIAMIELQNRQLVGASQAFSASVQEVKLELQQVATQVRHMDGEAKALLGLAAEDQQESFFSRMERGFAGVLTAVSNSTDLSTQTTTASIELQRIGADLRACIHDIRATWLEINRLAINSVIRAVHLGAAGEAMSVVAGAMQCVYGDAEQRSDKTEESLASLMKAVFSMAPPRNEDSAPVVDELQNRIVDLHESSERSLACGEQISAAAAKLCEGVEATLDGFTVGSLFKETVDRCCGILQKITAESNVRAVHKKDGFQHLAERYTMREERETHEMAMAGNTPEHSPAERHGLAAPVPQAGDIGENVELF